MQEVAWLESLRGEGAGIAYPSSCYAVAVALSFGLLACYDFEFCGGTAF